MFPWPIWSIILKHANSWRLRGVCRRFREIVDKSFEFDFYDFRRVARRGTVEILNAYNCQYKFFKWDFLIKELSENSVEVLELFFPVDITNTLIGYLAEKGEFEKIKHFEKKIKKGVWNVCLHGASNARVTTENHKKIIRLALRRYACDTKISYLLAISNNNLELVNCFRPPDEIPALIAFRSGNMELIKKVKKDWDDGLVGACENGHLEAIKYAISKGANDWKRVIESMCIDNRLANKENMEIFEMALEHVVDVTECDKAFNSACGNGKLNYIKALIGKGVKPTDKSVWYACNNAQYEVIDCLIVCGLNSCRCCNAAIETRCQIGNPDLKKISKCK